VPRPHSPDAHAGIPLAGLDAFAGAVRRTTVQQAVVAAIAVALLIGAVVSQTTSPTAISSRETTSSGVIVLDVSRSISPQREVEIRTLLKHFATQSQHVGLVFFSDTGYELLPPGTPGTELTPIIHYFTPFKATPQAKKLSLLPTPWDDTFRGGTEISTGLQAARQALLRQGIHNQPVVLVSDLNTFSNDLPNVSRAIIQLRQDHIPLRIVALEPTVGDRELFARLAGPNAFLPLNSLGKSGASHAINSTLHSAVSGGLIGTTIVLLALLAVGEFRHGRLALPARPREESA